MNKKKRLILMKILNLLSIIETPKNQSKIREIEGLLFSLINET